MADRKGVMLSKPADIRRLEHWPKPYIGQPKVEGWRGPIKIYNDGSTIAVKMVSSTQKTIVSVPHIQTQFEYLASKNLFPKPYFEIDGEFYKHGMPFFSDNKSITSISSIMSRTKNLHPDLEKMEFHAFDLIDQDPQMSRILHLDVISQIFNKTPSIKKVPYILLNTVEELAEYLSECMLQGYEGVIVRHPQEFYIPKKTYASMKIKPTKEDRYLIVGCNEEISKDGIPKDTLGSFICHKDGEDFRVGSGPVLTKDGRQKMWDYRNLLTNQQFEAVVKYQYLTPGRDVPYGPVLIDVGRRKEDENKSQTSSS